MQFSAKDREDERQSGSSVLVTAEQAIAAAEAAMQAQQYGSSVSLSPQDRAKAAA